MGSHGEFGDGPSRAGKFVFSKKLLLMIASEPCLIECAGAYGPSAEAGPGES